MSGVGGDVDDDNSMQEDASHVDKPASSARFKRDADDERSPSSSSIERKDSVRARANMFAQLQEKAKASGGSGVATPSAINREDRSSPRRASRRVSSTSSSPQRDDLNASSGYRAANADEEFEPSSLPLSERLRFFSNLSDSGRNSYVSRGSPPQPHSCMNGSSVERSASASGYTSYFSPRSSISIGGNSGGSASVTPTPMECSLGATDIDDDDEEGDTDSVSTSIGLKPADGVNSDNTVSVGRVKRTTSAFLALNKSTSHSHVATLGVTVESSAAIEELTPVTRRIKLRTIGKLMLPQTFLNASDRNNNSSSARCYASDTSNSSDAELNRPPVKKIGKIKSPFIENCQQLQQEQQQQQQQSSKCRKYDLRSSPSYNYLHSPRDSSSCGGGGDLKLNGDITHADPGKENIDVSNSNASLQQQDFQLPPIIEMRKKFTRMISGSNVTNDAPSSPRRQSMPTHRHSFNGSSHVVEERFAKYFGIASKAGGNHTLDDALGSGSTTQNGRARGELRLQHNIDADKFMPDWTQQLPMRDSSSATNISRDARLLSNKTSSSSLATPKRRDSAKRSRPMTAIINGTPFAAAENTTVFAGVANGMAGAGTPGRVLRAGRSLTITNGIPYCQQAPEVKKFEDIMVTKEEFQLASKEFERIFLGLA